MTNTIRYHIAAEPTEGKTLMMDLIIIVQSQDLTRFFPFSGATLAQTLYPNGIPARPQVSSQSIPAAWP